MGRFGNKASEVQDTDSDGLYLRNFKDGDTKVRFLQEIDDWIEFREHFTADKKSYPCTRDKDTCPGCTSENEDEARNGRKYAANVHVVKGNYVAPFRIPVSLKKKMDARSERNEGTILNRDYIVMRSGKGFDTEYDVEGDDKYEVNTRSLLKDGLDIEEILEKQFAENAPGQAPVEPKSSERFKKEEHLDEKGEVIPTEAEAKSESAGDSVVVDEDDLFDMTVEQLKDLAVKGGIKVPSGAKKSGIIRMLMDASQ